MQPLGHDCADCGLKNHPHPIQVSSSFVNSLAAQLWAFLQPVTQNQETRLLRGKVLWAVGRKADSCYEMPRSSQGEVDVNCRSRELGWGQGRGC